jgi:hypothetical protein
MATFYRETLPRAPVCGLGYDYAVVSTIARVEAFPLRA